MLLRCNQHKIKVIGVVGDDIYGRELTAQLQGLGADTGALVIQKEQFNTYTYLKQHVEGKELPRKDFGVYNQRSPETDAEILQNIRHALEEYDALIFNQQVTGSINHELFIKEANQLFVAFKDKIVVLDSRHFNDRFNNIYRKTNEKEIATLGGVQVDPRETIPTSDVKKYGKMVCERERKPVFVTCGSRGILVFDHSGIHEIPGIQLTSKLDTVGAGDTVISALTSCLAAGISPTEAGELANFAAAVTVQKLYTTGTASGEEILRVSCDPDFVYQADLAEDPRSARYLKDSEIELCDEQVLGHLGQIKYAVFDHDGTISTLRQGWEEIMEPVMIRAILGEQYETIDQGSYNKVVTQVKDFINKTTGIQTIFQMEGLVKMVREFGYVPESKILDKFDYKEIYNDALMEMVNERLAKLQTGELNVNDFSIKGSVQFLRELQERGVKMYLASGTDVEDVINEATLLGYAEFFDGGIYGALRDVAKFSKKMVIERIIKENNLKGNELVVFGDGPVEMRECRRYSGVAVGIASNEVRRFGLDLHKRTRLIKAGSQLLVPDLSQYPKLLRILFNEN